MDEPVRQSGTWNNLTDCLAVCWYFWLSVLRASWAHGCLVLTDSMSHCLAKFWRRPGFQYYVLSSQRKCNLFNGDARLGCIFYLRKYTDNSELLFAIISGSIMSWVQRYKNSAWSPATAQYGSFLSAGNLECLIWGTIIQLKLIIGRKAETYRIRCRFKYATGMWGIGYAKKTADYCEHLSKRPLFRTNEEIISSTFFWLNPEART